LLNEFRNNLVDTKLSLMKNLETDERNLEERIQTISNDLDIAKRILFDNV
jgi:hypothetical protein